ncbi:4Fe-4S binding protein [Candidatus Woesearchaeota archaeon]|nr:4Fe-4S binding protein [Candidatus Woesearchaeota archaeon]
MTYKITIDKEKCLGCGACTQCDNFEIKDGKAYAKKSEVEELGCNQEAVDICPADAIKVEKK